jgi:membrane protease YdiL (CAAX protease family)
MGLLDQPLTRFALSLLLLGVIAPIVVRFFRPTWVELDAASKQLKAKTKSKSKDKTKDKTKAKAWDGDGGQLDPRVPVTFLLATLSLLLLNEYGSRDFFDRVVLPFLRGYSAEHPGAIDLDTYPELSWRVFWGVSRYAAYLMPIAVWPAVFRENPLDLGLRFRGLREHAWIYLLCVVIVIPALVMVSFTPEFTSYYPMYKGAARSWTDFGLWEAIYVGQFLALEIFFRGFWLRGARSLGSGAIFSMVVPYTMIHFAKPYLEACGAVVAGTVLGSLSMRTGSIWAGFLIHTTVAILMDLVALDRKGMLPIHLRPYSETRYVFHYTHQLLWAVWIVALLALVTLRYRRRKKEL